MGNEIQYGPHLFPGGPEIYLRTGNKGISNRNAHQNILQTLASAFSNENSDSILSQMSGKLNLDFNTSIKLAFMNYGNMQLVYLATLGAKSKVAVLINQPHTLLGKIKKEYNNLQRLAEIDSRFVVKPFAYFSRNDKGHELYVSEYEANAKCVAVNGGHGIYDPLPKYHFEGFSQEISRMVNSSMVALFVNYYDSERKKGLSKTQISGNDFMLTRDFKKSDPATIQTNIKLIAARDFVDVSLDEYLDMLRKEFLIGTNRNDYDVVNEKIQINTQSKLPMAKQEIEKGIELGFKLRKQRKL